VGDPRPDFDPDGSTDDWPALPPYPGGPDRRDDPADGDRDDPFAPPPLLPLLVLAVAALAGLVWAWSRLAGGNP
jgi:hypothetical protein